MGPYKRLLIDISSVANACLFASEKDGENSFEVDFEGKVVNVASALDGYESMIMAFRSILRELGMVPVQCVMVKDGKDSRKLRRAYLPNYKDRPARAPEFYLELEKVINQFEETLLSYGGISVVKEGYEADDLIAALAAVTDSIIWSKDGDLMAAGDWYWSGELNPARYPVTKKEHITVYKTLVGDTSDKIPGAKGFGEGAFIDMVAKYGDEVLDDFLVMLENRELDGLTELTEEFKPFKKIVENLPTVYASYDCARFHHPGWKKIEWKAKFPQPNGDLMWWQQEIKLVERTEFASPGFLDRLIADLHSGPVKVRGFDIETWQDEASLAWGELNKPKGGKVKLDSVACHMAGFSLTCGANNEKCYYFPIDHKDTDNLSLDDMTMILNMLPEDGLLSIHNVSYELPVVRANCELHFDRGWLPNARCTAIMANYVDENEEAKLKSCVKRLFDYDQQTYDDVTQGRQMNEISGAEVVSYGADDSIATAALFNLFSLIMSYEHTYDVFEEVEVGASYLFAEGHLNGLRGDQRRLRELYEESKARYNERMEKINEFLINLTWTSGDFDDGVVFHHRWPGCVFEPAQSMTKAEIVRCINSLSDEKFSTAVRVPEKVAAAVAEFAGEEFRKPIEDEDLAAFNALCESLFVPAPEINLQSPQQICRLMYEALKLPIRIRNKPTEKMKSEGKRKGNPSGDDDAIKLAMAYDMEDKPELKAFFEDILAAKEEATAESFYYKAYPKAPNPHTGYIHYNPGQSMTTSRRAAPSGPNIGQASKKSPVREFFIPPRDDMVWVSRDFTGQELRITAERSQCEKMLACYPHNAPALDLHSVTGVRVMEIVHKVMTSYEEMNEKRKTDKEFKRGRDAAKAVNFGDIYGQTKYGLAIKLICTEELAQSIIDAKEAAFPGVAEWKKERRKFHEKEGYALTMMGGRKHVKMKWPGDEHALRSSVNFEVQGSAAEQVKLVLSKLWWCRFFERYEAEFQFPVHDEINYCVVLDDLAESVKELGEIMTFPYGGMTVPLTSSIEIGPNFGQLKEIGEEYDYEAVMEAGREALAQLQARLALGID